MMSMHIVISTCNTKWPRQSYPSKTLQSLQWASGAQLNDVVNVQGRTDLMRGRFEKGYIDEIDAMVKKMTEEIATTVEGN